MRCLICNQKLDNEFEWHCEDCKLAEEKKKVCYHSPDDNTVFRTFCRFCKTRMVAYAWRIE